VTVPAQKKKKTFMVGSQSALGVGMNPTQLTTGKDKGGLPSVLRVNGRTGKKNRGMGGDQPEKKGGKRLTQTAKQNHHRTQQNRAGPKKEKKQGGARRQTNLAWRRGLRKRKKIKV